RRRRRDLERRQPEVPRPAPRRTRPLPLVDDASAAGSVRLDLACTGRDDASMQNLFDIRGKVALVTGGSRGIGPMIPEGFVDAGGKVYVSSRKKEVCDEVAAALSKKGECISLPGDCGTEAGCRAIADALAARETALHILVNNAGNNWGEPFESYPDSAFDKVFALNVKGVFHLTRACLPLLEQAPKPRHPPRALTR